MPNCAANSACSSRRSSRSAISGVGGYPTNPAYGSNPSSRRSSGSRPGSRRESFLTSQDSSDSNTTNYISASALAASAAQMPSGLQDDPSALSAGQSLLQSIGAGVVGAASTFSTVTPPRYRKPFLRPYQHF